MTPRVDKTEDRTDTAAIAEEVERERHLWGVSWADALRVERSLMREDG